LQNKRIEWDINEYGIPINQEDMAATLLAFSVNVIDGIAFVAGRPLSINEQLDYLALWRYLGWLLGIESQENNHDLQSFVNKTRSGLVPLDPCGTRPHGRDGDDAIIHSRASLESIICHLLHPNESSVTIARHLLSSGRTGRAQTGSTIRQKQEEKSRDSFAVLYRSLMCRRCVGDSLANTLKLPRPTGSIKSLCAYLLTTIILWCMRVYTLLTMISWRFRRRAYVRHLNLIKRFDKVWGENHGKRMEKAAKDAMENNHAKSEQAPSCPFALVMPPLPENIHLYKND